MIREDTAIAATPGTILLSRGEILLPKLPECTRRSHMNGLITSALTGGVQKPASRILLPSEKQVAALSVNADGKIVEQAQAPKGNRILLPNEDEVDKLSVVSEAKEDREKSEKQALLFYISQPWSYLNNRLEQVGVGSPVGEMQGQINDFRANAPKISPASKTLLRSPIKSIREMEKKRLLENGISETEYQAAIAPDIALIDVSNLDFITEELENDSLDGFYDFLNTSIDELFDISASGSERVRHLADVCQRLNLITQAFLYKSGNFKLDNAVLLEKVTSKLEFLTTGEFKNSTRYLQPLFDFISYFDMNNSSASSYLLEILEANSYKHPLINELIYQLNPEDRIDKDQPKIGIEVEAIPSVIFGDIPHGFELGVDDGLTMPEIRREKKDIQFDITHKKDLYDFWYFAKMTQLRGASVHIHIDDPNEEKIVFFQKLLGVSRNTVNQSLFGTVELRFNLSSYEDQFGRFVTDMATPFFHEQFDITSFIEALMEYSDNQSISPETMSTLPDFWKIRLEKAKPISFDEVMSISKESGWNWVATVSALKRFHGTFSIEQVMEISKKSKWDKDIINIVFKKINAKLSPKQAIKISEESEWDEYLTSAALEKLDGTLSLEQVMEISEKSIWNYDAIELAFEKLDRMLSLEQVIEILENLKWEWYLISPILKKLDGTLSLEQTMDLLKKSKWDPNAIKLAFEKLDGIISLKEVMEISEKSNWDYMAIKLAFEKLNGTLSFKEIIELSEKSNWDSDVIRQAFEKLDIMLSFKETIELLEKSNWKWLIKITALENLGEKLSFEQVMYILKKSKWDSSVIKLAFKKLDRMLSFKEVMRILEESSWNSDLTNPIFKKMDETLSSEQIMEILEKSEQKLDDKFTKALELSLERLDETLSFEQIIAISKIPIFSWKVVELALEKLDGMLSLEQVADIIERSGLDAKVVKQAFEKLDGMLSLEQVVKILENSNWNRILISPMLKKLDGTLSLEQAIDMSEKSRWGRETMGQVFEKLDKKISFEQIMESLNYLTRNDSLIKCTLEKLDGTLSLEQILEISERSGWNWKILTTALKKLEKNESYNLEALESVPKNQQLLIWSLLLEGGFKKPMKLKESLFRINI